MRWLFPVAMAFWAVACSSKVDQMPLQGSVRKDDPEAQQLFAKAKALEDKGQIYKASKLYGRVATKYPFDQLAAKSRFTQAWLLDQDGELRDAFDAYQQFIERYPGDPLYKRAIDRQEQVAHAAAQGLIKTQFLGLKSNLDYKVIEEMLQRVRKNAPRANSAPRAQHALGQLYENRKKPERAISAYEELVGEFPNSGYAPNAQFRIGEILLQSASEGNQDQANLERAKNAYQDLLLAYPSSEFASQARQRIASIGSKDIEASYKVAEFYRKKGQLQSAAYYYQEVINKSAPGPLRDKAAAQLAKVNQAG